MNYFRTPALVFFISVPEAHAYLDPGTGSIVLTAILGVFAAIGYTFRKYYHRFFGSDTDEEEDGAKDDKK